MLAALFREVLAVTIHTYIFNPMKNAAELPGQPNKMVEILKLREPAIHQSVPKA